MRIVRCLLMLAVAAGGLVLAAVALPAAADPYPVGSPALTVSAGTVTVGDSVEAVGTGYGSNETVNVDLTYRGAAMGQLGGHTLVPIAHSRPMVAAQTLPAQTLAAQILVVDGAGGFNATVTLDRVGTAVITAVGMSSGVSASATVIVLPAGSALPVTGNDGSNRGMWLIGSALATAGVVIAILARSRRRPADA